MWTLMNNWDVFPGPHQSLTSKMAWAAVSAEVANKSCSQRCIISGFRAGGPSDINMWLVTPVTGVVTERNDFH